MLTVVDRYLLFSFAKILAVCFVSLSGLFIVLHLFTNLDDFLGLADKAGGATKLGIEFYGPRVLDLFDRTAPILTLLSAVAALALMQRRQELTSLEAAGIPRSRLFMTLVAGAILVIGLTVANREYWIPKYQKELLGTLQNWRGGAQSIANFQRDHESGFRISGAKLIYDEGRIKEPVVQIPAEFGSQVSRIVSKTGWFLPAEGERPAGLLLEDIIEPANRELLEPLNDVSGGFVCVPPKHLWLKPNQILVRTSLTLDEMAYGQESGQFVSLKEMMALIRRPTQWYSHGNRIALHSRIVKPVLDLTLLLVALPMALLFTDRNLFLTAMVCVAVVAAFQVATITATGLGSFSLIKSSALAAWLPVILFLPTTVFTLKLLNR